MKRVRRLDVGSAWTWTERSDTDGSGGTLAAVRGRKAQGDASGSRSTGELRLGRDDSPFVVRVRASRNRIRPCPTGARCGAHNAHTSCNKRGDVFRDAQQATRICRSTHPPSRSPCTCLLFFPSPPYRPLSSATFPALAIGLRLPGRCSKLPTPSSSPATRRRAACIKALTRPRRAAYS